jgi:hypothetical protein
LSCLLADFAGDVSVMPRCYREGTHQSLSSVPLSPIAGRGVLGFTVGAAVRTGTWRCAANAQCCCKSCWAPDELIDSVNKACIVTCTANSAVSPVPLELYPPRTGLPPGVPETSVPVRFIAIPAHHMRHYRSVDGNVGPLRVREAFTTDRHWVNHPEHPPRLMIRVGVICVSLNSCRPSLLAALEVLIPQRVSD